MQNQYDAQKTFDEAIENSNKEKTVLMGKLNEILEENQKLTSEISSYRKSSKLHTV